MANIRKFIVGMALAGAGFLSPQKVEAQGFTQEKISTVDELEQSGSAIIANDAYNQGQVVFTYTGIRNGSRTYAHYNGDMKKQNHLLDRDMLVKGVNTHLTLYQMTADDAGNVTMHYDFHRGGSSAKVTPRNRHSPYSTGGRDVIYTETYRNVGGIKIQKDDIPVRQLLVITHGVADKQSGTTANRITFLMHEADKPNQLVAGQYHTDGNGNVLANFRDNAAVLTFDGKKNLWKIVENTAKAAGFSGNAYHGITEAVAEFLDMPDGDVQRTKTGPKPALR